MIVPIQFRKSQQNNTKLAKTKMQASQTSVLSKHNQNKDTVDNINLKIVDTP